ncbi:flagellar hook-basal body protein [Cohnella fermenti]|uniref:Flagellar hook-basal body protein n=1 Tax=Cohnella fermenti TaxID=2565925 RepID=A0A4S4BFL0_9BACL|nr:flagellar hook-basal body protein [Cohnella fermenti]THF73129.1 flagellar hook-basal body protein [Cohnella fermenti]
MLRGLYTATSGMIAQQRRHDTVTNNIANLNTPGYKGTSSVNRAFPEMLIAAMGGQDSSASGTIGKLNTGVFAEESLIGLLQGDMMETDRSQDMALISDILVDGAAFDDSGKYVDAQGNVTYQPQAFFTLQSADGELRYTRNGSFQTTADGTLVSSEGLAVLGTNGQPINVQGSWDNVTVASDGTLYDSSTNEPLGQQLYLTKVANPNQLIREGDGLFRYEGQPNGIEQVQAGDRVSIQQGFLERSNVDSAQSAVDLMAALRAYAANQQVVKYYDSSLQKAVNEVGKV